MININIRREYVIFNFNIFMIVNKYINFYLIENLNNIPKSVILCKGNPVFLQRKPLLQSLFIEEGVDFILNK
jgi:hypothetical protein